MTLVEMTGGVVEVQATQARLTPGDIAKAREQLVALDYIAEADDEEFQPVVDKETQILPNRTQALLESASLNDEQTTLLLELLEDIDEAKTQDELDDLAEELLDALFDLE